MSPPLLLIMAISFENWKHGMSEHIFKTTGCNAFSGAGICPRPKQNATILRSVDGTPYYDDDLSDINNVKYTLFGHNGDQDVNEKKFNKPLLASENIYLYRVKIDGKKKEYIWYGKYEIVETTTKINPGKDGVDRNIIILSLQKIDSV